MALTYGIESLAVINKGGGLRRLAAGQTTEYLRGDMTWAAFPTTMAPTAHNHAATDINSGTLDLVRLPRIAAGSIYVGAGTSNDILTLAKGSALQALRTNADATALEWYTTQWKDGIGTGSIKTNSATATGLRSGDEAKPYVYWSALAGQDLKAGGLAGTDQKWMLISPSTVATYAYGGEEYTYNNATANYVFLLLIDSADFIGSATSPFNRCRIIANAGTNYLYSYGSITFVGTPITGNVYPVIVSTGSSSAPSGINYTESVSLYAPLKTSATTYTGSYSVASGRESVASGPYSVASGPYSVASGFSSVASGNFSVASGNDSVASGPYSVASGPYSVASGFSSVASGASSVASGRYSVASGNYSVALGERTIAGGSNQTVIGKWNIATTDAFIIGNGENEASRSNCMTVDFSGNMTLAGSVKIPIHAGLNRLAYFDSSGTLQSDPLYTLSSFASASHSHSIPDLYCGVPNIVPGRILISGSGASSNPVWLDVGTTGQILGWTSGAPAWVDAPYAAALHTHLYAGSAEAGGAATTALACTGNAATATKLATTRALTIGSTGKNFDGTAPLSWTLAEIGAAPATHNHSATEITSGELALARIPTGTTSSTVALGNHTHLYAGSATAGGPATTALACTGNAATATKLATTRALTIGSTGKNFDGTAPLSWTLAEIGAAPATHTHDAGDIVTSALAVGNGGTGRQSFDINALIMGGTQYNGSLQSLPSGLTREVLAGGGIATSPRWLSFDEYERFSVGGTAQASATQISAKSGISEKLVFIDPGAETTPQTISYFKAPAATGQSYGDRIVLYCCSGDENYKYIVVPSSTEKFCDLIGGQYTGNIEASYGNKIELVCLPKSGAKAWYVSRIALINNN